MAIPRLSKMLGFGGNGKGPSLQDLLSSGFYKMRQHSKYEARRRADNINVGEQLAVTPGGRHAWFRVGKDGRVRKPI